MANRVEYAVSATTVATVGVGTDYTAHDVIEKGIGKTLGGSASVLTVASTIATTGFAATTDGQADYGNCPASGYLELGGVTQMDMVFIKNTGKTFSSASVLGDTTADLLIVSKETAHGDPSTYAEICRIPPGGAICLPNTPTLATDCAWSVSSSGSTTIAVEYALIT
jgi:hypothetical protein|tara:strand:+ start:1103 stop:1603 length:501 start_codon:yes stop_codon:yes gene_type:complete